MTPLVDRLVTYLQGSRGAGAEGSSTTVNEAQESFATTMEVRDIASEGGSRQLINSKSCWQQCAEESSEVNRG
jgi:hypothetical protein